MPWQQTLCTIALTLAGLASGGLALYIWQRRHAPGAMSIVFLMVAASLWSIAYALQLASVELATEVFFAKVQYFGIVVIPVAGLAFALQYSGRAHWLRPRNIALLFVIPIITLVLVWTNEAHELIWRNVRLESIDGFSIKVSDYGAWFIVHFAYSYLLMFIGTSLIITMLIVSHDIYRRQAAALLIFALSPMMSNLLYVFGLNPLPYLDLTPFAFNISGLALAFGLFRFRLADLIPVAYSGIIESMDDSVIVLDSQDRIIELNPAAKRLMGESCSSAIGQPLEKALPELADKLDVSRLDPSCGDPVPRVEVVLGEAGLQRIYDARMSRSADQLGRLTCQVIALRETTQHIQAEQKIKEQNKSLRNVLESLTHPFYVVNIADYRVELANSAACPEGPMEGLTCYALVHRLDRPCDRNDSPCPLEVVKNTRKSATVEHLHYDKDGNPGYYDVHGYPVFDDDGNVIRIIEYCLDITERRQMEDALRESEARLRATIESLPFEFFMIDQNGRYIMQNSICRTRWGNLIGKQPKDLDVDKGNLELWKSNNEKAFQGETVKEEVTITVDGEEGFYHNIIAPILDQGKTQGILGVNIDITERRQMEEELLKHREGLENLVRERTSELREANAHLEEEMAERSEMERKLRLSEERYRTIFEQAADSILLIDAATGAITEFNDKAHENLGYTREEFQKLEMSDIEALESNEDLDRHMSLVRKNGVDVFETKHKTKSGEIQDVLVNCKLVSVGNRKFFQSIWRDITERKRMETALRQSERKYRSLVDLTSDSVYELDENLKYTYVSGRGGTISGRKPEDHIGRTPFDFMPEEEKERVSEFVQSKLDPPQSITRLENTLIGQDGRPVVVETSAVPIYDLQGKLTGYLCVDRDITVRKEAEMRLRQREAHLNSILETSLDGIAVTSEDHKVLYGNPALASIYGYEKVADLIGTQTDGYFAPENYPVLGQMREKLNRGEPIDDIVEFKGMRQDGSTFDAELRLGSFLEEGRRLDVAAIRDVSDRKKMEFQLNQSSKLASVGELATGVAHEINNPIAAIDVHAGLVRDVFEDVRDRIDDSCREQIHSSIRTIEQQVERCRSITNNLLSFTRIPRSEAESFGINELLEETSKMVASMSLSDTDVELNFDYELPSYWGSPNLLQQVFVNLLTNALKATGTQGKISISTSLEDDENIRIQFTDSGHGIPQDIRERIFDPFFTTSPEGEGTGLGLSISYYIVKQLNGEISVDSIPGHGTTFVITLPIAGRMTGTSRAG